MNIELKCCTCGASKNVSATRLPGSGFEFYNIVKDSGWYPVLDMWYGRSLCFCDDECMKKQLTKKGYFRKRLIYIPKEDGGGTHDNKTDL